MRWRDVVSSMPIATRLTCSIARASSTAPMASTARPRPNTSASLARLAARASRNCEAEYERPDYDSNFDVVLVRAHQRGIDVVKTAKDWRDAFTSFVKLRGLHGTCIDSKCPEPERVSRLIQFRMHYDCRRGQCGRPQKRRLPKGCGG